MKKKSKLSSQKLFFLKSFLKTFALLLLPLTIISAYSLYRFQTDSVQTLEARNRNLIYQIQTEADSMFQTVDTISGFLTGSASVNRTLQNIFLEETPSEITMKQASSLATYLQSILASNHYVDSCYLYYDNDFGRYFAASGVNAYLHHYSADTRFREHLLTPGDSWVESGEISSYSLSQGKNLFAIYQKLYSAYSSSLPNGILVTYFDVDHFQEYISNCILYPGQVILFLQGNQAPLFQTSQDDFSGIWEQLSPNITSAGAYSSFTTEYRDNPYLVSLIPASDQGIYYVSLIPKEALTIQTRPLKAAFLLIAMAACVLSIFLSMVKAKKEYAQLQTFIDLFDNADKAVPTGAPLKTSDPYQLLLHKIVNLFLEQKYLKLQLENKQYENKLLELQALQHQINPHFLFNTLNTIYWNAISLTGGTNTCASMISSLSEIMSYSMGDSHEKVPLRMELEYLKHYVDIQQIRYDHKFEVIWDVDDQALEVLIPKMILQPLVENAIYHGIKEKEGKGTIKVRVCRQEGSISIRILDNGIGVSEEKLAALREQLAAYAREASEHIGLLNTNRRLILCYGESAAIQISSRYGMGTVISFLIPAA